MTLELSYHAKDGNHVTRREEVDMVIFREVGASSKMVMWDFQGEPAPGFLPKEISNPGVIDLTMEELDAMRIRENISAVVFDVDVDSGRITSRDGAD